MADLYKVMERECLHSEHAAQCFLEAKRRDNARKKNPKCPKCGCSGVLNTANADDGANSEWTCWAWQCNHVWKTPNLFSGADLRPNLAADSAKSPEDADRT